MLQRLSKSLSPLLPAASLGGVLCLALACRTASPVAAAAPAAVAEISAKPVSSKHQAEARALHTALWTGDAMLIWGGLFDGQRDLETSDGAAYYPASDRWFELPKAEKYSRYYHSAVWTGKAMIVWGGLQSHSGEVLGSGLSYNVKTERWSDLPASNAPAARSGHSAVWAGDHMLVFGGQNNDQYFGDGAAYMPAGRAWTALNSESTPSPRAYHTAIWTGAEMIIWGGTGTGKTYLNTGALFHPDSGKWTAMPTLNAPSPRLNFSATWTGTQLIVWGGRDVDDNYLSDGAIYDLATNKWLTIKTDRNTPPARELHAAVWDGKEMVVWGGHDAVVTYNKPTFFDPETRQWHKARTRTKIDGRYMHSAVWTGKEMLVFGGRWGNHKLVKKRLCFELPVATEAASESGEGPMVSADE